MKKINEDIAKLQKKVDEVIKEMKEIEDMLQVEIKKESSKNDLKKINDIKESLKSIN